MAVSESDPWVWQLQAICRNAPEDLTRAMFKGTSFTDVSLAKSLCRACPVRFDCVVHSLEVREPYGIWGGLTEQERRHLLRTRPGVAAWRHLLETAIAEYDLISVTFDQDFAALFHRDFHRLVGFLITAGARRQDAEDAVQMAFVELARHWVEVCERVGWLRRVAHRMWSKVLLGRRELDLVPDVGSDVAAVPGNDEVLVEQHRVLQLLSRLPEQQRVALAFAYDGCTPTETAEALGVPPANVRQNLRRGRSVLARLIAEEGVL